MIQNGQEHIGHTETFSTPNGTEITLAWAALTDTGRRREANEDSFLAATPIFAVADGMGGHSAGDVASAAVVSRLAEHTGESAVGPAAIDEALRLAVQDMRHQVGLTDSGSGTTVTGAAITTTAGADAAWLVFNIGDSRVYALRAGQLEQLTRDHSVVQELIDSGHITPEEAEVHPHSNVITRAVGFHEAPVPDYQLLAVEPGVRLLICSDGLTKELTNYGIRHFLLANPRPADAAAELVGAALGNGGRDNVTVVVVDVVAVKPAGSQYAGGMEGERS
ncbi:PP2C family protein-serine/threonine phosphatase [Microterricola viridarii]|uniref:Protein phosphatase n=1 Tax=Microterricola viridarii TaxID=412690 RepID=A0A1H1RPF2_9MICO|nr:protein phosphatase [Microterricola viridarii]